MPLKLRDGALVTVEDGDAAVSLEQWRLQQASSTKAVRLEPEDDALELGESALQLERIEVNYPAYTDGRAHTQAHLLRQRLGFTGEIRAVGDVRPDQIPMMIRCGVDAFAFDDPVAERFVASPAGELNLQRIGAFYQAEYRGAAGAQG